jgi:hypothetical protein
MRRRRTVPGGKAVPQGVERSCASPRLLVNEQRWLTVTVSTLTLPARTPILLPNRAAAAPHAPGPNGRVRVRPSRGARTLPAATELHGPVGRFPHASARAEVVGTAWRPLSAASTDVLQVMLMGAHHHLHSRPVLQATPVILESPGVRVSIRGVGAARRAMTVPRRPGSERVASPASQTAPPGLRDCCLSVPVLGVNVGSDCRLRRRRAVGALVGAVVVRAGARAYLGPRPCVSGR